MKTKHLLACMALMLGSVALSAAEPGTTCYTAIPLGKDYKADITGPQTVWYSAWTFDLPLSVYFAPQNESDPAPEVELDFTCNPGVYTDPIIATLTTLIRLPYKVTKVDTEELEGRFVYVMSVGKEYRDLLLGMGIDYNVEAFIKVTYKSSGTIGIAPAGMFSSCMDGAKFMHFGDTIRVKANDLDRHVIVPYVQWKSDSIYYIWSGTKKATVTVSATCKYDPTDAMDERVLQRLPIQPGDTEKVTSEKLQHYVDFEENEAGMFFAKCYSESDGVLTIKKVPQAPPRGGAILLKYGKVTDVPAHNANALFAIHKSWEGATKFTTPTDHIFRMYIGTDPDFTYENAIAFYQFLPSENGHWLGLFEQEMTALWKQAAEQYLYVRFECTATTTILPTEWEPSECISKCQLIPKGESTQTITKGSYGKVYRRLYYNDWRGGDMTLKWNGTTGVCPAYIGNTCDFEPDETEEAVIASYSIPRNGGVWTITAAEIDTWADKLDPDGYLYLLCNPSKQSTMDISTTAPDETDPVYPHATIHVECQDGNPNVLTVTVSEPQHITVTGENFSDEWEATPAEPHTINLPSGQYTLTGTPPAPLSKGEILLLVP